MTKHTHVLEDEKQLGRHLLAILVVTAISGYLSYFMPIQPMWLQWVYLLHVLFSLAFAFFAIGYLFLHLKRALGIKRPTVSIAGIGAMLVVFWVIGTGFHICLFGQQEGLRWVYRSHVEISYLLIGSLVLHLVLYQFYWPKIRSKEPQSGALASAGLLRLSGLYLLSASLVVVMASITYPLMAKPVNQQAAVQPYQQSYGPHPFRPSQTETSTGSFLDASAIGNSGRCGACHQQIVREWQASIHSQAGSDKTYQRNVNLLSQKKGMATTRYCEGCHSPVALISGQLSEGGKLDTVGHMQEGVNCLTCHGMERIVHTKGVASFRFALPSDYLFERNSAVLPTLIHNFLLRIQPRQHRADMARASLAEPAMCATCHVQFMDKDVNGWGWVQMQDEYTAWLNSPYSKQTNQSFAEASVQRCQDCHFPLVNGKDPSANSEGMVRSHRALGGNTAIPFFTGNQEHLEMTKGFLRADKVRLSIEVPERTSAVHSNKPLAPDSAAIAEIPNYVYLNELLKFNVIVANTGVGHNFPGGTLDINEAWIHVRVVDGQNHIVFESGGVNDQDEVAKDAYFYKSLPVDRHGEVVWRHDLFNMVGDSYKRAIPAGKSDTVPYEVTIPSWVKSPLMISATLNYRKFNNRYAHWALEDETVRLPIVDISKDALSIPIRIRPEADASLSLNSDPGEQTIP